MSKPLIDKEAIPNIYRLAKLGPTMTPADIARVLGLDPLLVSRFVARGRGRSLYEKARAEGRAELLTIVRNLAVEGSPQAQKMYMDLAGITDDARSPEEAEITAAAARAIMGTSRNAIQQYAAIGWMPPPERKRYKFRDILKTLPRLWCRLKSLEAELADAQSRLNQTTIGESEARRLALLEVVRRRKRENDVAAGRLVLAEKLEQQARRLAEAVKVAADRAAEEIPLHLQCTPDQAERVAEDIRAMLARIVAVMEAETNEYNGAEKLAVAALA